MRKKEVSEAVKNYQRYLDRATKNSGRSLWDEHRLLISKEIARAYGVTETEMRWLNENL